MKIWIKLVSIILQLTLTVFGYVFIGCEKETSKLPDGNTVSIDVCIQKCSRNFINKYVGLQPIVGSARCFCFNAFEQNYSVNVNETQCWNHGLISVYDIEIGETTTDTGGKTSLPSSTTDLNIYNQLVNYTTQSNELTSAYPYVERIELQNHTDFDQKSTTNTTIPLLGTTPDSKIADTTTATRTSTQIGSEPQMCTCPCLKKWKWAFLRDMNLSKQELRTLMRDTLTNLGKENAINTKTTSTYRNKKQSATDDRTSSRMMGVFSVVLLFCTLGLIVFCDVIGMTQSKKKQR